VSHIPSAGTTPSCWSNFFAQTEALMNGKTAEEAAADCAGRKERERTSAPGPHKVFEGNRPTIPSCFKN